MRHRTVFAVSVLIGAILFSIFVPAAVKGDGTESTAQSITVNLTSENYSIIRDKDGLDTVRMEGFSSYTTPGKPMLPHKAYNILLPPNVIPSSLELKLNWAARRILDGQFEIKPTPPYAASDNATLKLWGQNKNIVDGKDTTVYGSNVPYPYEYVQLLQYSQMRNWIFTSVDFTPFQYDPSTKKLTLIQNVQAEITYQVSSTMVRAGNAGDTFMDSQARQLFYNYDEVQTQYSTYNWHSMGDGPTYDYVIITTNAIVANSTKLADFITHKQGRGFSTLTVTETQWGAVTGQAPNHKAEKIRKWLQDNYIAYGIHYVLLIGNPCPYENGEGDVPMKMCLLDSDTDIPTDRVYADLTGNWDLDGNGIWGEMPGDTRPGGVDAAAEVYVGRIPVYGSDYASLDSILQKTIAYENESDTAWRRSALLPMSFSDEETDGAYLAEQMKTDYLSPLGYDTWSMYTKGHSRSGLNSIFPCDQELLHGSVKGRWAANDYGLVCWWAHGNSQIAAVFVWADEVLFSSPDCPALDNAHPSFVFQCSCDNGEPEDSGNLQFSLLKQGGIETVAATRSSYYYWGQQDFKGSMSNAGVAYEYGKRLTLNQAAGSALCSSMQYNFPNASNFYISNYMTFYLCGDPSVTLFPAGGTASVPTIGNGGGASSVTSSSARLRYELLSTGNAATNVTVYWGKTDGGTDAVNWTNHVSMGQRDAGAASVELHGLDTSTDYFYRSYANNTAGEAWAPSSSAFHTFPTELPPVITGTVVHNISRRGADITVNLASAGNGDTFTWLYYGKSDGGTDRSAWAHNPTQGPCGSSTQLYFSIYNLTGSTRCYYRAYAENEAGSAWDTATGDFTTLADPPPPTVFNYGVDHITPTSATVYGNLTSTSVGTGTNLVCIFCGKTDGGNDAGNWDYYYQTIVVPPIIFHHDFTGLSPATRYFYKCYASSMGGYVWTSPDSFMTAAYSVDTSLGNVVFTTDKGDIGKLTHIKIADTRCSTPRGYDFPYGMFSFNITKLTVGQTVRVTIKFPRRLPAGSRYYKCLNGKLLDCSRVTTHIDDYTLALDLTDGGFGDADGRANGTIADPGGPAEPTAATVYGQGTMTSVPQQAPVALSAISVKSAYLSATKVAPGEPVMITANVANTGTASGSSSIQLYINGEVDSTQGVRINSGSSKSITFTISRDEPGTYIVYVDGAAAGSFTVEQPVPDTILAISTGMVLLAFILGVIYVTRRKQAQ